MSTFRITASDDGPRLTVNQLIKSPTVVPRKIISMVGQGFMVDQLLRSGPPIPGGSLIFSQSDPLYADDGPLDVAEFGEIPLTTTQVGTPMVAKSVKKAMGFRISQESIDRNNFDKVQQDMVKLKNSFARSYESVFLTALLASLPSLNALNSTSSGTAGNGWMDPTAGATKIYDDLSHAVYNIKNADSDSSDGTGQNKFEFSPDTIVLNDVIAARLLLNPDITKVLQVGNVASTQPLITGDATETFLKAFNLKLITSWRLDPNKAILLESKTVGGISDERPMGATPLYEHRPTETWRTDVTRISAVFIDQPKAGLVIQGIAPGATAANFAGGTA
jgi:hypothetical protein